MLDGPAAGLYTARHEGDQRNRRRRRRVMGPLRHGAGRQAGSISTPAHTRRRPMRVQWLQTLVVGAALMLAATTAYAQQPAAAPPPPPPYGPAITLEQAKKVMAGAEAEANKNKWNVVISVLDSGGNLVMVHRMDGAQWGSIEVAREKA